MNTDPIREAEKVETRIQRELDFRLVVVTDSLLVLKNRLDSMEANMDARFDKLEDRRTENSNWTLRFIAGIIVSFIFGGGAIGILQFINSLLARK